MIDSSTQKPAPKKTVVRVQSLSDLPKDAVLLTKDEVVLHHMRIVENWENKREVWPLRHSVGILSAASAIGGFLVNAHYRQKFKLRHYGRVATYLPAVCLPGLLSALFHQVLITNNIIVGNYQCTVCVETKSGLLNMTLGVLYPLLISPISCIILARKHHTMLVPNITEGAKVFSLFKKTSPLMGKIVLLMAGQFFLGMFLAERQIVTFHNHIAKSLDSVHKDEGMM